MLSLSVVQKGVFSKRLLTVCPLPRITALKGVAAVVVGVWDFMMACSRLAPGSQLLVGRQAGSQGPQARKYRNVLYFCGPVALHWPPARFSAALSSRQLFDSPVSTRSFVIQHMQVPAQPGPRTSVQYIGSDMPRMTKE